MSIELKGNDESTFTNDVTIDGSTTLGAAWGNDQSILIPGDGRYLVRQDNASQVFGVYYGGSAESNKTVSISGDGSATFAGGKCVIYKEGSGQFYRETTEVDASLLSLRSDINGTKTENCVFKANGSATFGDSNKGVRIVQGTFSPLLSIDSASGGGVNVVFQTNLNGAPTYQLKGDGSASFSNVTLALDTGGTLDVKERLQNTQAILYRLKAALIQPDADANQLRTRLLEALDILTSDGDES